MNPLHRIRLGPPWAVAPAGDGRDRHARRFGRPTNLGPGERVWLVCHLPPGATATVNGVPADPPADITDGLLPRNEVVIHAPAGVPVGDVGLEIRTPATFPPESES